jgi:hypothetical protein
VQPHVVCNLLSKTNSGRPLQPLLTDRPIGRWTASPRRQGGRRQVEPATDVLVGLAYCPRLPPPPGLNDWSDTIGEESRVRSVHTGPNVTPLGLYHASWMSRRTGQRARGKSLGLAGFGVSDLRVRRWEYAVRPGIHRYEDHPREFTDVLGETELDEGQRRRRGRTCSTGTCCSTSPQNWPTTQAGPARPTRRATLEKY